MSCEPRARRTARAARLLLCLAAAPALMGSKCEEPLVKDSGFDVWCGDSLCAWRVDEGGVAKVPTWHERDYGVELVGGVAQISQLLPLTDADLTCIHIDLLADVDDPVNVVVALDFDDDGGSPEHQETVPNGSWTPLSYHFTAPTYFHSVRISIRKQGDGHAALAEIAAARSSDCSAPPPPGARDRPAGATCEIAGQCAGGLCLSRALAEELIPDPGTVRRTCEACATDGDCAAGGGVCGLGWSAAFVEPHRACAPPAAAVLGDRCVADAECATGACCDGVCSTCCADAPGPACAPGEACAQRPAGAEAAPLRVAWQCAPGAGRASAGTACLADADCAGGRCVGGAPLTVCAIDGRRCGSDADCPGGAPQNSCIALGVAGGRCQ